MSSLIATVVVVTWNGRDRIEACLSALMTQALARDHYRVLVVDNASADGTAELVESRFPSVDVIRSRINGGFAGGCALALQHVATPFAVLVNDDAVAQQRFLGEILAPFDSADGERLGAVTGKVLLMPRFVPASGSQDGVIVVAGVPYVPLPVGQDDPQAVDMVNSTGNEVDRDGYGRDRDWLEIDDDSASADVFGFCGAAAALRMDAVRGAGGFDASYFLYYEDTDLSWRLRLAGHQIRYSNRAVVRHHHAQSSVEGSAVHRFYDDRNRLFTLTKNAPPGLALRAVFRYVVTTASIAFREMPHWQRTRVRVRVLASYARHTLRLLVQRREGGKRACLSRGSVAAEVARVPPRHGRDYRAE